MEACNMNQIERLNNQCLDIKLKALEIALNSGSFGAHIGGSFSCIEILASLYELANIPDGNTENRDRIILSKGHSALSLYTVLWKKGLISDDELKTFDTPGTRFHVHPHRNKHFAVEASTGSLGLGFSYGVGVAFACRRNNLNNRIFVLLGDGECDEGIVWEAAMSAAHYNLNNLTVIIDVNGFQVDGETTSVMNSSSLVEKFKSFGFDVCAIDGHDIESLLKILPVRSEKPRAIIANTIKAHGISFLENNKLSHQCSLTKKKYQQAVDDIKKSYGLE